MPTFSVVRLHKAIKSGVLKPEASLSSINLNNATGNYNLTFRTDKDGLPVLTHDREHQGQTRNFQHLQKPYPQPFKAKSLRAYQWGGIQVDPISRQLIEADGQRWDNIWQLGINRLGDILISINAPNIADGLDIGRRMVKQLYNHQYEHELPAQRIHVPLTAQMTLEFVGVYRSPQRRPPKPKFSTIPVQEYVREAMMRSYLM
ncbi:uncharacterized protein FRV6_15382 [Fusarium oxysporum]|uniref:Uncharacterized protein n=1 Tax=Fusarium oxysporum TaxID=5507 RepID=A0A2H3TRK9_FUSOX|nr:uncharacterized protein FRV6_15382 [Fusarium oxysporum]